MRSLVGGIAANCTPTPAMLEALCATAEGRTALCRNRTVTFNADFIRRVYAGKKNSLSAEGAVMLACNIDEGEAVATFLQFENRVSAVREVIRCVRLSDADVELLIDRQKDPSKMAAELIAAGVLSASFADTTKNKVARAAGQPGMLSLMATRPATRMDVKELLGLPERNLCNRFGSLRQSSTEHLLVALALQPELASWLLQETLPDGWFYALCRSSHLSDDDQRKLLNFCAARPADRSASFALAALASVPTTTQSVVEAIKEFPGEEAQQAASRRLAVESNWIPLGGVATLGDVQALDKLVKRAKAYTYNQSGQWGSRRFVPAKIAEIVELSRNPHLTASQRSALVSELVSFAADPVLHVVALEARRRLDTLVTDAVDYWVPPYRRAIEEWSGRRLLAATVEPLVCDDPTVSQVLHPTRNASHVYLDEALLTESEWELLIGVASGSPEQPLADVVAVAKALSQK